MARRVAPSRGLSAAAYAPGPGFCNAVAKLPFLHVLLILHLCCLSVPNAGKSFAGGTRQILGHRRAPEANS
jgi:hypothetical protein